MSDLKSIKNARTGTLVQPVDTDEEWEVLAKFKDSDEIVLRHSGCLQTGGHVFTYEEFEKQFERR